ncbi:ovarian-specific serine/threonine-protein kinase Lok-like [Aphidius gifuensis]|uniref:ovarian-specific serine/threonine-protein kinase Lok-like n=1 Tax=Aphidius gifuensis TaxID=684658 RepID=UPI001CDC1CC5|nr:ovarian-specific serine/threonine-protein kinase Lok-like [Aphidius gifuensis]
MDTRLTGLNSNKNDDEDRLPDTQLPGDESQSQSSSSTPNKSSFDTWAFLIPCQSQLDQHDPYHNNNRKPLDIFCLIKNEYTAGRLEHVDIQFNEENTDLKRLLQTSKTQFIIKRERVTNYKTADYEGDFVVFIYDKSMNGTYINKKKLKNNKGILLHNDTISIASPNYKGNFYN